MNSDWEYWEYWEYW